MTEEDLRKWAADKERQLDLLYDSSTLPAKPDQPQIRQLLLDCLEEHYGDLTDCGA
ncbi:hypothetical protein [Fuerstiella marisgermanici]|uniref:hypothetical protein n=1 Tax=Fuerstiella marisgermanici TaxID=1891926 RepID=UPI001314CFBF|nr:hypothetical protein [Fuerstiella marisgermanici]